MTLSEAIRLGAMATAAIRGPIFGSDANGACGTCAIGAPLYALFGESAREHMHAEMPYEPVASVRQIINRQWPWTITDVEHPVDGHAADIVGVMVHLYERIHWTREQIADWVETIEAQQPVEQTEQQQVPA